MTIYYHGTPLTPSAQIARMAGEHFCVSFYRPDQADVVEGIGASVMWDNGAFSAYTKGETINEAKLHAWLEPRLYHPHRAVALDVIGGSVEDQRSMNARWPMPRSLSWAVWHLDKPLEYLDELASEDWAGIALGSAGEYWNPGSEAWYRRVDEVFEFMTRRGRLPWLHGLRMLGYAAQWPFASVDSTSCAQNFGRDTGCAYCKSRQLKGKQHGRPKNEHHQDLFGGGNG